MLQLAPVPPAHSVLPFTGDPRPLLPPAFVIPSGFGGADIILEIGPFNKGSAPPSPPTNQTSFTTYFRFPVGRLLMGIFLPTKISCREIDKDIFSTKNFK